MEAAQLDSRRHGQRDRCRRPPLSSGGGSAVSHSRTPHGDECGWIGVIGAGRTLCRRTGGAAQLGNLSGRRWIRPSADSLDVVAGNRRCRGGHWRTLFSASARRRLRRDRDVARSRSASQDPARHLPGERHHLVGVAGLGNIGRSARSTAHHGRRPRWLGIALSSRLRSGFVAASKHGSRAGWSPGGASYRRRLRV